MRTHQNETYEIKPAAPDAAIHAVLSIRFVQSLPLTAGTRWAGEAKADSYTLIAAVRGNLTVSAYERYTHLATGQVLVLCQDGPYTIQAVSDCLCMSVCLEGELPARLLALDGTVLSGSAPAVREAVLALAVLEQEHPPVDGALASSYAYTMLVKLHHARSCQQPRDARVSPLVESAIAIIQEEFPFLEGLDELSERLEVSKAHLSRSFMRETGVTPGKYITYVRIEYAKLLLRDEGTTISYVAEASGFANANYFAKVFRKQTGMSPSEYLEGAPKEQPASRRLLPPIF
ncbi:MAG: helix-turn-helix transcriptional regulator [Anaerotruncus sp.]|jgi:AraC-like DNA-binding protein|nr:helix-turn-helix transcriptional regulator [Anaerotruncus sp.]